MKYGSEGSEDFDGMSAVMAASWTVGFGSIAEVCEGR